MHTKKRILICNDAHFLFTGYAKYGKEVLSRLQNTGKFEIAELACYGAVDDKRCDCTWRYYANTVTKNHPEYPEYCSNKENEHGRWRFERVCLDFKPHIVMDIRDPWYFSFQGRSPFRPYYNWNLMPTVDSHPQKPEWMDMISHADNVFAYSNYGKDVIENESGGAIKVKNVASPGVDLNTFSPTLNKDASKAMIGFPNINILGTIMRNQSRKLYPDLFEAFRKFIDICYEKDRRDIADKTFLYVHAGHPDVGWDLPELLKENELCSKVLFTYICNKCKHVSCDFFKGPKVPCKNCNTIAAMLPSTTLGLTEEQLAGVLNCFDGYIQYANCEGFGMPQVEAVACGVPVMSVDYSAMQDIIENCHGIALPVKKMSMDTGTYSYRAIPDNDKTAEIIYEFFNMPVEMIKRLGRKARKAAEYYYNWDRTAKFWEDHFDSIELTGYQGMWDEAPKVHMNPIPVNPPEGMEYQPNSVYVEWLVREVLQQPSFLNSYYVRKVVNDLNFGAHKVNVREIEKFDRELAMKIFHTMAQNRYICEGGRVGDISVREYDYIRHAHDREQFSL